MRDTNDEQVRFAARLQARDGSALRELFEREGGRALGLAYRVLGDQAAAEDAVQEAFAQLWERAERLDPAGGRIESLLMTMVYRRAIDLARARRNGAITLPPPDMLPHVDEQAAAVLERVVELLSSDGLRRKLRAALHAPPEEQRVVVDRAYFEGLTLREIAEQEHLPLGTVKSRLRLAMEKLTVAMGTRALS